MTYNCDTSKDSLDRIDLTILNEIANNPLIHQNALIRRLVNEQKTMAKRTVQLHLSRLIKDNRIRVKHQGKRNLYQLELPFSEESIKIIAEKQLESTRRYLELFEHVYQRMDSKSKIQRLSVEINQLRNQISSMALLPCITLDPEDRILSLKLIAGFQDCLFRIFALVYNDPRMRELIPAFFEKLSEEGSGKIENNKR